MSYLVLARKYRPKTFDEVVGQEHVTNALKSAIAANKVAHAFLFSGPRGVGKTTCARILAKEINKAKPQTPGLLEFNGSDLDIMEIDGASNRGIDEARTIRENAMFVSMSGGYKFYIIDEVHMLTEPAFNALLKTLEEPPAHVKFIFATTDPDKVPTTIRSRCQHFNFKRLSLDIIKAQLKAICKTENLVVDEEAYFAIARAAQGGMRDALGILDQLASSGEPVTLASANNLLGLIDVKYIFDITDALIRKDAGAAMAAVESIITAGKDDARLLRDMVEHFRHLMITKIDAEKLQALVDYPVFYRKQLFEQTKHLTLEQILKVMDIFISARDVERLTDAPRLALELALVKAAILLQGAQVPAAMPASAPLPAPNAPLPPSRPAVAAPKTTFSPPPAPSAPRPAAPSAKDRTVTATAVLGKSSTLLEIKHQWNSMTSAVQAKKPYLAACLLDGYPTDVTGNKITIAFPESSSYQKDSLEDIEAVKIIGDVFEEVLGHDVSLAYIIAKTVERDKNGALDDALEAFQGELVNEWHSDDNPNP